MRDINLDGVKIDPNYRVPMPNLDYSKLIKEAYGVAQVGAKWILFAKTPGVSGDYSAFVPASIAKRAIDRNGTSPALGVLDYTNILKNAEAVYLTGSPRIQLRDGSLVTVPNAVAQYARIALGDSGSPFTTRG
jgi:hypothetical protein